MTDSFVHIEVGGDTRPRDGLLEAQLEYIIEDNLLKAKYYIRHNTFIVKILLLRYKILSSLR